MSDQTYNGWTNYETWLCNLWMDNDQGLQEIVQEWAQEYWNQAETQYDWETRDTVATTDLAERLEQYWDEIEESMNLPNSGLFCDLLRSAMGRIDWREIARHYIDEVDRATTSEEANR